MADQIVRFQIEGRQYQLDVEDMTFDEWDEVERVLGGPFEQASRIRSMRALIYTAIRRENPAVSFDEVGSVKPARIDELAVAEDAAVVGDGRPPVFGAAPPSESASSGSGDGTAPPQTSAAETTPGGSGVQ